MAKELKKPDRAELSRRAWEKHRESLMAGAKKAAETRKQRYPKKKRLWICRDKTCQMEVLSAEKPKDRTWDSGHTCRYGLKKIDKKL